MSFLTRPKVLIYLVLTLATGGLLARELGRELATPEERVRFSINEALDDFNDEQWRWNRVLDKDFRYEQLDRDGIGSFMWELFWQDPYAVLLEDQLEIDIGSEVDAKVELAVDIFLEDDSEKPWWPLRATVRFKLIGDRWRITRILELNEHERGGRSRTIDGG